MDRTVSTPPQNRKRAKLMVKKSSMKVALLLLKMVQAQAVVLLLVKLVLRALHRLHLGLVVVRAQPIMATLQAQPQKLRKMDLKMVLVEEQMEPRRLSMALKPKIHLRRNARKKSLELKKQQVEVQEQVEVMMVLMKIQDYHWMKRLISLKQRKLKNQQLVAQQLKKKKKSLIQRKKNALKRNHHYSFSLYRV